ncbi:MAG: histidinol-phosphatase HisJ family protein [Defluviitaleaceae bacterium]|nr:histidinol-phosphatase HisJ family protein [Defluviitaleaceae bacterium]
MYFDSHVHSAASPDSQMNPVEAIAALGSNGMGVAFTEHVDFAENHEGQDPTATDAIRHIADFLCDFEKYHEYESLRMNKNNAVTLGLELGLTAAFLQLNEKTATAYNYDFILGSVHAVDGVEVYHACRKRINEPVPKIDRYLTYAKEMVELCGFFDAFGHIDYIARFCTPQFAADFKYENFPQEFDALLKAIAERDISLEINTSRFGRQYAWDSNATTVAQAQRPEEVMLKICKRFAQLGGRFCTLGSDAHQIKDLGRQFATAKEIAAAANLTPVYYRERKPIPCE